MKVGVVVHIDHASDVREKFTDIRKIGFDNCQVICWDRLTFTEEKAEEIIRAAEEIGIEMTAFWCGWEGPRKWNFTEGPLTLGLVPAAYRASRIEMLKEGSDFAKKLGIKNVVTHAGFMPENPYDQTYRETIAALRDIVDRCRKNGQNFLFETGQETPITLKRAIEDLGKSNLGINIDPANLLLYGKANPCDALDVFGEYVMGVHGKDGEYPTNGTELGIEKPLGEGRVHFDLFVQKLHDVGYDGSITIEREISGDEQIRDILKAKKLLEKYISEIK